VLGAILHTTGRRVESVRALMRGGGLDVADVLALELSGGAPASVASTGTLRPGQPRQWELRYYCEDGMLLHDLARGTLTAHANDGEVIAPPPGEAYPTGAPVRRLIDLVLGEADNPAPGWLGAHVTDVVAAAYRSAGDAGTPRTVPHVDRAGAR
jgi:predicted dehydrogenase